MKSRHLIILSLGLGILFLSDLAVGSVSISPSKLWALLRGQVSTEDIHFGILFKLRLPRALTAVLAGIGLSISGLQMQTLFRNPLAGPSVLGISSGASLGVAVVVLGGGLFPGISLGMWTSETYAGLLLGAAILGSLLVLIFILSMAFWVQDQVVLLIIGLMVGTFANALVSFWQYFSHPESIQEYLLWTFGSLSGVTLQQVLILSTPVLLGSLASFMMIKQLNILLLGENYARSSGLDLNLTRALVIAQTGILTGAITAFCGPIAFIGITVPHMARSLFHTSDHRILMPLCLFLGPMILLACDLLSKLPFSSTSIPINIVTSLMGAPLVVYILLKSRIMKASFG